MRRASVQASLSPSLHPALQAALGSLDVQLEAELTRYRRQRHLQRRRQHDAKPMNVIAVQAVGGRTQPQVPPVSAPEADPWQSEPAAPLAVRDAIAFNPMPDPVTVLQPDDAEESEPDDYLASSEELLRSLAEEEAELRRQRQAKGRDRILTPLGIGSLVLLLLSSATLGYLVLNPGTLQSWNLARFWNRPPVPEATSLESPAAIEGGEAIAPSIAPSPDLSSQEFHDLNLDTLSTLPMSPAPAPLPSPAAIASSPNVSASPNVALSPSVASSPSLPAPASSTTIPARPRAIASPTAPPAVTVPRRTVPIAPPAQRSSTPRSTAAARPTQARPTQARPAAPRPAARPARSAQQAARPTTPAPRRSPAARPAPRPAAPAASAPAARPSTPPRYVVVSPYSGDRSLEQAQRVVGDAYVRNLPNGAQVQYGAFSDGDRARELSQQLQQQGISAQVVEADGN